MIVFRVVALKRKHFELLSSVMQVLSSTLVFLFLYKSLYSVMGAEGVGIWALLLAYMSIFRVVEVGFSAATSKYVAKYKALEDFPKVSCVVQTLLLNTIGCVTLLFIFLIPWYSDIVELIVPDAYWLEGLRVLPWLVLGVFIGGVAGILESAVFGLGRIVARNVIVIASSWVMLYVALLLLPGYGLQGVAIAFSVQSTMVFLLCCGYLKFGKTGINILSQRWSFFHSKESLRFVFGSQVISILFLLFDPMIKAIVGHVGGMGALGYFDMARQCVVKVRSLLLSVVRMLEPRIIDCAERSPEKLLGLFIRYHKINIRASILVFGGFLLSTPLISLLWLGALTSEFLWMASLLTLGWFLNTIGVIAYVFNTALGDLRWNFISHLLMLVLSGGLALIMGEIWGLYAAVFGVSLAIALSGMLVLFNFFNRHNLPMDHLLRC